MDEYATELHPHKHEHAKSDHGAEKDALSNAHDLDLENAIGDAFKQLEMLNESHDSSSQPNLHAPNHTLQEPKPDADLESVVGDVFGSLARHDFSTHKASGPNADYQPDPMLPQAGTGSEPKDPHIHEIDDIHHFKKELPNLSRGQEPHADALTTQGAGHVQDVGADMEKVKQEVANDESNSDLEAAIGDAFKNLSNDSVANDKDLSLGEETFHAEKECHDQNLEDAIGEVFQNLTKTDKGTKDQVDAEAKDPNPLSSDDILRQAISQSLSTIYDTKSDQNLQSKDDEAAKDEAANVHTAESSNVHTAESNHHSAEPNHHSAELNHHADLSLAGIVQDVVERINASESQLVGLQNRRQSLIDELAGEISHKVNNMETDSSTRKDIPVLDDTVLAHFQTVANKEDSLSLDSAIKSAVASAVNTATPQAPSKAQVPSAENESDLEKLHMNEILQNAFNMAMSNPHELITSLDIDESQTAMPKSASLEAYREQPNALSTAAAIAALSVKDALTRKDANATVEPKEKPSTKPLSIAQTLALHRASMAGPAKRDYSAIQTLEDSMKSEPASSVQMNPQLSNILSSLSHHIQSGTQSQNLMSVIRQMTNALMLTKTSISVTKRVQEIMQELKKSPDSEKTCIEDLKEGKRFLMCSIEDSQRAQTLLTSIIGYIQPQEKAIAEAKLDEEFVQMPNLKQLKELYDCAHTAITGYNSTRFRAALTGVKRDVDSSEYKERVRTENRERKKKWREENAERNKDNDLRARVLRRAAYMFGEGNSREKTLWMEDEFSKRREKRFARQQKEENGDNGTQDSSHAESKGKTASLHNPKLSGMLAKYLHLVGEGGSEMIPEAASVATCAVIAVAVFRYSSEVGVKDMKQILSTITQMINSILDASIRSGDYMKLPYLVKTEATDKNKELKEKYSAIMESRNSSSESAPHLKEAQKREYEGMLQEPKRKKTEESSYDTSFVKPDSDQPQPRPSSPSSSWNTANALKMPHYRKPLGDNDAQQHKESVTDTYNQSKPVLSPFISNKVGKDSAISAPSGLRKPGSFQRPAYARPSKSSGGFSALYSTSFKQT